MTESMRLAEQIPPHEIRSCSQPPDIAMVRRRSGRPAARTHGQIRHREQALDLYLEGRT